MTSRTTLHQRLHAHGNVKELREYHTAEEALARICSIYTQGTQAIRDAFSKMKEGKETAPAHTTYPYVGINISHDQLNVDATIAFGAAMDAGVYGTTLTRPDIFYDYYLEQLKLLIAHHKTSVYVGVSNWPIPLPFVSDYTTGGFDSSLMGRMQREFSFPDLSRVDDTIVNSTYKTQPDQALPLALFTGERVDYSLHRLHHYSGTSPEHFQRFILLTNYQRYIEEFITFGKKQVAEGDVYSALVEPGDVITSNPRFSDQGPSGEAPTHLPQMPTYHLKRPDRNGITFINIGIGPTNAKNITDHLAVLRPHCWIMLGHCAGLRRSQLLGDYVLAHGYVREDHVLDQDLPPWVPVPAIAEVQVALQQAVANITGQQGHDLKTRMRTGTVVSTDNRNWELKSAELSERFNQSRAIALDMESATVAANGFRFRVPYGTLLCVSDKPLHGELKLRGMANNFYQERVSQHLKIGLESIRLLQELGVDDLHSRKLRGFSEPAFR